MAQKKSHEVDGWLARPDRAVGIVLLYGPDRGLVAERAERFVRDHGPDPTDGFALVRLDGGEVDSDPARLSIEARTIGLFGGDRLIWIRHGGTGKGLADAIADLCADPSKDARVLVEAGDLKKTAPLRTQVEKSPHAIALPCYPDEERDLDRLIEEVFAPSGIAVDQEARRLLRASLGGDRLASRRELEKLALYAMGQSSLTPAAIGALLGDVSARSVEDLVDSAISGDVAGLDAAFALLSSSGQIAAATTSLLAMMRQMQQLMALRARMEQSGMSASQAVAGARPPVFFARRKLVETALSRLGGDAIGLLLERLHVAILETRRTPRLAGPLAYSALAAIAARTREGARRGNRD